MLTAEYSVPSDIFHQGGAPLLEYLAETYLGVG